MYLGHLPMVIQTIAMFEANTSIYLYPNLLRYLSMVTHIIIKFEVYISSGYACILNG